MLMRKDSSNKKMDEDDGDDGDFMEESSSESQDKPEERTSDLENSKESSPGLSIPHNSDGDEAFQGSSDDDGGSSDDDGDECAVEAEEAVKKEIDSDSEGSDWSVEAKFTAEEKEHLYKLAKNIPYTPEQDSGYIKLPGDPLLGEWSTVASVIDGGGKPLDILEEKLKKFIEAGEEAHVAKPKKTRGEKRREKKLRGPPKFAKGWFNMPAAEHTPEFKAFARVIHLRNDLFANRFYKDDDRKELPTFAQIGTVVSGAADYSKLPRKTRKKSFIEQRLAETEEVEKRKKRYVREIMDNKMAFRGRNKVYKIVKNSVGKAELEKEKNKAGKKRRRR